MKRISTNLLLLLFGAFFFLQACGLQNEKYIEIKNTKIQEPNKNRLGGTSGVIINDDVEAIPSLSYTSSTNEFVADVDGKISLSASLPSCANANACVILYEQIDGPCTEGIGREQARVIKEVSFPLELNYELGCLCAGATYNITYKPVDVNSSAYVMNVLPNELMTYCN